VNYHNIKIRSKNKNMAILEIRNFPDPILRQVSKEVDYVSDEIRKLMDDMMETMYSNNGVGLAAVQIGILKRILVMDTLWDSKRYKNKQNEVGEHDGKIFMANPKIIKSSRELSAYKEGCLSFPGLESSVERPGSVEIEYLDYYNKKQILKTANSLLAVCVQHEIDHLNGITFIDKISKLKRDMILKKIKKQNAKF
jgi:peptide deformylase